MSTRSRIGIYKNGRVESVYCHYDGYPSYVGTVLFKHYNNKEKVQKLINLGDISILGETTTFDTNGNIGTRDYNRWRNEKTKKRIDNGIKEYKKKIGFNWEQYLYLFKNNKWYVYDECDYKKFTPLEEIEECKEEEEK